MTRMKKEGCMMTEEMYEYLHKIVSDRAQHCDNIAGACSYKSVLSMLEYAHEGNIECLRQFDYYGEND